MTAGDRIADLEAVRDLALRFAAGLDREDRELLRSVFWPDATDDHGRLFSGLAWDFADVVLTRRGRVRPTLHCVFNHRVWFGDDPDRAAGEVYSTGYQFRHAAVPPSTRVVVGRYLDDYERRHGEWRIRHRQYVLDGMLTEAPQETSA